MNSATANSPEVPYRLIADNVLDVIWLAELIVNDKPSTQSAGASLSAPPAAELRFTYFTPSVRRILGYSPDEAVRMSLAQFLTPEAAAAAMQLLTRLLKEEQATGVLSPDQTLELDHVRKDGSIVTCEIKCVFLRDEQLRPIGTLGVSRDITQRKQSEEALCSEQRLLNQLLELQERERQILAYEIHDGLVQQLTAALMHLESSVDFAQENSKRSAVEHERGMELLRESVRESRRLISGLRPPILDEYGIIAAIEYLASETRRSGLHVDFAPPKNFRPLARPLENTVFRIVQEALTNVRRHSQADEVRVELSQAAERLRIVVEDRGVGFLPENVSPDRFGLRGIRERARLLEGNAVIQSSPEQGTRVEVELPLLPAGEGK